MKRPISGILAGATLLLTLTLAALPAQGSTAIELVDGAINRVLDTLREDEARAKAEPEYVLEVIEREIIPLVDIDGMARLILARHWRDATDAQRTRFTEAFRDTLLNAYGVRLADYLDRQVNVIARRSREDERMAVVATEIVVGSGQPNITVNYRLRPVEGDWRVFDVEAEGLSFVGNFRNHFNTEINRDGLDALIERLEAGDRSLVEETIDDAASGGDASGG
ncbi:Toluene tolerance protein [Thioalkalivibrio nitratireducens DSM 14787]|uniref:Toluene tolerance protein n=1 Tax=Thioalkalivibrio nitratireducens (strain DSM 14787 / UNIQEM 213 / ALEN2) TaxID=1255043 RepID=L0DZ46_THIND|nr:ABC transporter substrate-binding protein [Thioalkalivibrio nitratireducens]AGA34272.1 Toluene tolerance protein [Thioalkalivibrio nitratireducens DSM 14787]